LIFIVMVISICRVHGRDISQILHIPNTLTE
jgi:hypothetical protein